MHPGARHHLNNNHFQSTALDLTVVSNWGYNYEMKHTSKEGRRCRPFPSFLWTTITVFCLPCLSHYINASPTAELERSTMKCSMSDYSAHCAPGLDQYTQSFSHFISRKKGNCPHLQELLTRETLHKHWFAFGKSLYESGKHLKTYWCLHQSRTTPGTFQ